jgi:hypothetical protein
MSDHKATNPKDGAATTRLDMSLFPSTAAAYGALAFTEGDQKYGGYNWRKAHAKASVYKAALERHMSKWFDGEEEDPATGVPHLANAIACIAVLIDAKECGTLVDDRPPAGPMPGLLARFEKKVAALFERFPRKAKRYTETEKEAA